MNTSAILFSTSFVLTFLLSFPARLVAGNQQGTQQDTAQEYFESVEKMKDYQMPPTKALSGQRFAWGGSGKQTGEIAFGEDGRVRSYRVGDVTHSVDGEVFEFADELYFMAFTIDNKARGVSITADRQTGRLIEITSWRSMTEEDSRRIQFKVFQSSTNESGNPSLPPLATSDAMVGARFIEQCADDILYEHVYLNAHRVTWHAITGAEAGQADTEYYDAYTLRPGVHLVTWSEKVMATHATFLFNFTINQNIGFIFGHDPESDKITADTFGCKLTLLQAPGEKPKTIGNR